jgi:hypothetical protein
LIAVGVNSEGKRDILGLHVTAAEEAQEWLQLCAELTGDPGELVRAARKLIREDRSATRPAAHTPRTPSGRHPNGPARLRQPNAKRIAQVIPTPVETDRGRH